MEERVIRVKRCKSDGGANGLKGLKGVINCHHVSPGLQIKRHQHDQDEHVRKRVNMYMKIVDLYLSNLFVIYNTPDDLRYECHSTPPTDKTDMVDA